MSIRRVVCLGLLAGLLPLAGCGASTVIKQAYYEVRGAEGTIKFIDAIGPGELARFQAVRFEPASTTIGPRLCPSALRALYDRYARALEQELREHYPGGEPALTVSTEILFFEEKGLLGAAQFLSRVRFTDSAGLVGDALVNVVSKSFREGGADALAATSVRTIGEVLKKRRKPQEVQ